VETLEMKIGNLVVQKGEKAFVFLAPLETRGRFPVRIPLHIVHGKTPGPVLLVQAGVSGLEIEPAMILPRVVEELDASSIAGTLLLVPLLNVSGFEFDQVNAIWDDKNLNELGRGKADGTVSEQMIHTYYRDIVTIVDAVVDIHTGGVWGYYHYAGVYKTGAVQQSQELAVALGLPQVLLGQPRDRSIAFEAAVDGKAVVSAWIGGGPGMRDHREADMTRVRNAVLNAMKHLGILSGGAAYDTGRVSIIEAHSVIKLTGERGLVFLETERRGTRVRAGEKLGLVKHPFTGDIISEIKAPRDGIMVHAGTVWPIMPEGATLAILGDLVTGSNVT
jgi:predicted deacylase